MTTPTLIRRALTFDFSSSIQYTGQAPATMEVAIIAIVDASNPTVNQTFIDPAPQVQTVLLAQEHNLVTFDLVPSDYPGLSEEVSYRVMWRQGITGRTYTQDFTMPDQDCNWADLANLGNLISGAAYLQQSDLSVPGRVAQLNDQGEVVDASGTPVATASDLTVLEGDITTETLARQTADANLNSALQAQITQQVGQAETTMLGSLNQNVTALQAQITQAQSTVSAGIAEEATRAEAAEAALQNQATAASQNITALVTDLTSKADLHNGTVPLSEIPAAAITTAITVADQMSMLSLTSNQIKPGWIAVVPSTGTFLYIGPTISDMGSWINLNQVVSVNGKVGQVVLVPGDIGALAINGTIQQAQVTGLLAALQGLTPVATTQALQSAVVAIQDDATIPHLVSGLLPKTDMPSDSVFVANSNLVDKNGNVLSGLGGGGEGGGAVASVNGHVGIVVLTASDIGAIPETQITNLSTGLTTINTNISALQTEVANIQTSGSSSTVVDGGTPSSPGGGTPPSASASVFWDAGATAGASTPGGLAASTYLHSPFGVDTTGTVTGTIGEYYINPAGASAADLLYPYITPNGHLQLRRWNESNPADPTYALETDLTSLATTVASKANESDLIALQNSVVSSGELSTLNQQVSSLQTQVTNLFPIAESQVTNLSTDLANRATLSGTGNTVPLSQLPQIPQNQVLNLPATLTAKADLSGGTVPLSEIPVLPQTQITGLATALTAKADLVNGTVPLSELPSIPQSQVTNLTTTLAAKADLVNGVLATSQIPALTIDNPVTASSTSVMTSLSTTVAHIGTVCIVTGGTGQGSYILSASDPTQLTNWLPLGTGTSTITSVNGQTGPAVVLAASDVNAYPVNTTGLIPQAAVNGLSTIAANYVSTTALSTAISSFQSAAQIRAILDASGPVKALVAGVATSAQTLSGTPTIDGVAIQPGSVVLLTFQGGASSPNNGLWTVTSSGNWTRPADYSSYFLKDTIVMVSGGTTYANTFWQQTNANGLVGSDNSIWVKVMQAGPPLVYTAGNGITIPTGTTAVAVNPLTGGGISATSSGVSVDSTVCRKYTTPSPLNSGGTVQTVTHNLGTTNIGAVFIKDQNNNQVLACSTVISANQISIEFATAPTSLAYYTVTVLA